MTFDVSPQEVYTASVYLLRVTTFFMLIVILNHNDWYIFIAPIFLLLTFGHYFIYICNWWNNEGKDYKMKPGGTFRY